MTCLFLPPEDLDKQQIVIHGENARYLSSVLRMKPGELLTIFDGKGNRYICRINEIHKKEAVVEKIKEEAFSAEPPILLTLAQGIPKTDKMDFIIQKATELGVHKIIPLITKFSQIRHTAKTERWRKIAQSASQQSGREKIPLIDDPILFGDFLALYKDADGLIFSEEKRDRNLREILNRLKNSGEITLIVGPEGGLSHEEVESSIEKGFTAVSLGPRILRTETAPIIALSIIQYELGDISS
jgi:16S rRNA (uracil1498-N3)-methyltransferase